MVIKYIEIVNRENISGENIYLEKECLTFDSPRAELKEIYLINNWAFIEQVGISLKNPSSII